MNQTLYMVLKTYDNWANDEGEEKNLEAKKALERFYKELSKQKPAKNYERRDLAHMSYFPYLIRIKKAFQEQKYTRVCNELISLMHYEPFLQGRIYHNVLRMLEEHLEIGDRKSA